jgi:hypothetical protein
MKLKKAPEVVFDAAVAYSGLVPVRRMNGQSLD